MCSGNTTNVKLDQRRHLSAIVTVLFTNVPETFSGSSTLSSDATDSSSDSLSTRIKQVALQKNIQTRTPCSIALTLSVQKLIGVNTSTHQTKWSPQVLVSAAEILLSPANEVWGKVIFPQACVSHSIALGWGRSSYDVTSCLAAWSHVPSGWVGLGGGVGGPVVSVVQGESLLGDSPPNKKSGQYASYWNAFLFHR